jgi:hypothetical protein
MAERDRSDDVRTWHLIRHLYHGRTTVEKSLGYDPFRPDNQRGHARTREEWEEMQRKGEAIFNTPSTGGTALDAALGLVK